MIELPPLDDDACSVGYLANASQQTIGVSVPGCDFDNTRGVIWVGGTPFDLNALIPSDSRLYLTTPQTINDRGEIVGNGFDANGNQRAWLLIPCDQNHPDVAGCDYSAIGTSLPTVHRPQFRNKPLAGRGVSAPCLRTSRVAAHLNVRRFQR